MRRFLLHLGLCLALVLDAGAVPWSGRAPPAVAEQAQSAQANADAPDRAAASPASHCGRPSLDQAAAGGVDLGRCCDAPGCGCGCLAPSVLLATAGLSPDPVPQGPPRGFAFGMQPGTPGTPPFRPPAA